MKTTTRMLIATGLLVAGIAGVALATPIVGLVSPFLSIGTDNHNISSHGVAATANGHYFNATLTTDGPSNISIQEAAFGVGAHNGWHSHPGLVAVTVLQGSIEWFDQNCNRTVYNAGDSWTEGSAEHYFRVLGTTTVQLTAVFITAKGEPYRTDKAQPACAVGLGLE
jgi:quercetin dioxygenase-like cupin family protein